MMTYLEELIGTHVRVASSSNASVSLAGTIVDETKNMLTIDTPQGRKRLIKSQHTFEINRVQVAGTELLGRPEERIKRWIRRKSE
jgi:RNase P/RNase MRP subunit p29